MIGGGGSGASLSVDSDSTLSWKFHSSICEEKALYRQSSAGSASSPDSDGGGGLLSVKACCMVKFAYLAGKV